jgi:alpha-glucosidase
MGSASVSIPLDSGITSPVCKASFEYTLTANIAIATIYAADAGDPIDDNVYGSHPVFIDTRYYEIGDNGSMTLVTSNETSPDSTYLSYSHGAFLRNAHGQEILMRSDNITWRTLGKS